MEVLLFLLVPPVMLAFINFIMVQISSRCERFLRVHPDAVVGISEKIKIDDNEWIESQELEIIGGYKMLNITFLVWKHPETLAFVVAYSSGGDVVFDFVTPLEGGKGLTVSNVPDAFTYPVSERSFKAYVPSTYLGDLFEMHQVCLGIVEKEYGVYPEKAYPEFEPYLAESMRLEMEFVKTHSFWPFRGIYWFFITRSQRRKKPIEEQLQFGLR